MKVSELAQQLGTLRFSVILLMCLLGMSWFGYLLSQWDREQLEGEIAQRDTSIAQLKKENESLTSTKNQLEVQLELSLMRNENILQTLAEQARTIRDLSQDKAFYQHVIAPETTQDGFFVDGLTVSQTASDGYVQAKMVLLQQTDIKGVVRGELHVTVEGSMEGKPATLTSDDSAFMAQGPITFGFKFFQPVTFYMQLPQGFTPEQIRFDTQVYQYKRKRGDYTRQYQWQAVVNAPTLTSAEG